jgi:hypothetical protein
MDTPANCPACGADWSDGKTCEDHFHQMLFWENEYPELTLEVHNLLVTNYYIQHPHLYSPQGLANAILMLGEFLSGVTPQEMRAKMRDEVNSSNRKFKITGTPESHGSYPVPIAWTMFPRDITSQPVENYKDNIRAWSHSMYEALKQAGVAT